jgi:hypothetical protein
MKITELDIWKQSRAKELVLGTPFCILPSHGLALFLPCGYILYATEYVAYFVLRLSTLVQNTPIEREIRLTPPPTPLSQGQSIHPLG